MINPRTHNRIVGGILGVLLAAAAITSVTAADAGKPNIVLMFLDNVGYGDLGCYGNGDVKTPNIDKLARQGVRCTDFYIGSPSCMPSRGALMTGRHPVRNGLNEQIYKIDELEQAVLALDERLLPEYLKPQGYATGCLGKWNLGFAPGHRPTERGFDEYFGNISGNFDYYTHIYNGRHDLYRGTEPVHVDGYATDLFADAACDFIRRNADQPFLCYVPFNAAHFPNVNSKPDGDPAIWQAPDSAFEAYGWSPQTLDESKRYRAVLTALDAGIGRIMDQLDELNLTQNTITIVLSDNGAFMLSGRGLECASNKPLKSGGTTLYEGGIRVPCIVRWPARLKAGTMCSEPLISMDFVAMALNVSSAGMPADRVLDGRDPIPALAGEAPSPHEYLYFHYGSSSAIRWGQYKALRQKRSGDWELFDLATDIGETANRASAKPQIVSKLAGEFERWFKSARRK